MRNGLVYLVYIYSYVYFPSVPYIDHYLYADGSCNEGGDDSTNFTLPVPPGMGCVSFQYAMPGIHVGSLIVSGVDSDGDVTPLWTRDEPQTKYSNLNDLRQQWWEAQVYHIILV